MSPEVTMALRSTCPAVRVPSTGPLSPTRRASLLKRGLIAALATAVIMSPVALAAFFEPAVEAPVGTPAAGAAAHQAASGDAKHARMVVALMGALALLAAGAVLMLARSGLRPARPTGQAAPAVERSDLSGTTPSRQAPDSPGASKAAPVHGDDAAQLLRRMMDFDLAGIAIADLDGRILEANDAFLRIVGYDREDLHARRITRDTLIPADRRHVTLDAFSETRAKGACTAYEEELQQKDGARVPVLLRIALMDSGTGETAVFVLDQSASRRSEVERQARLQAESANRAKSDFLTQMSHELRTPLNAILGFTQILRTEPHLNERNHMGLSAIQFGAEHLLQLIVDLLDLARIEAGRLQLEPHPTDIGRVVADIRDLMGVKAHEKSVRFVTEVAGRVPHQVMCDDKRLRQVLLNMLGNAVKFTDKGEVKLRVESRPASGSNVFVRFEVFDTGIGISADELERLFRPYEQVGDFKRRGAGTGLGLAISQQIVQQMGGTIRVESQPCGGSRFWFEVEVPSMEGGSEGDAMQATFPHAYSGARRRILVVDNEPLDRGLLTELLSTNGFVVTVAHSGEQALAMVKAEPPDLVLMDVAMPVMDGLEATRRLRQVPELWSLPVICVSASNGVVSRNTTLAAGADAFVAKPVDLLALLALIVDMLAVEWQPIR
jgi:PAS domain S-box-containing protein